MTFITSANIKIDKNVFSFAFLIEIAFIYKLDVYDVRVK